MVGGRSPVGACYGVWQQVSQTSLVRFHLGVNKVNKRRLIGTSALQGRGEISAYVSVTALTRFSTE